MSYIRTDKPRIVNLSVRVGTDKLDHRRPAVKKYTLLPAAPPIEIEDEHLSQLRKGDAFRAMCGDGTVVISQSRIIGSELLVEEDEPVKKHKKSK